MWPAAQVAFPLTLPPAVLADRVVVEKAERRLTLWRDGETLKSYEIALGEAGAPGTPEGRFRIAERRADAAVHRSLDLAALDGGEQSAIRGLGRGYDWVGPLHLLADWTDGEIAVTDEQIEEIWRAVPLGTPVEIRP